MCGMSLSTTTHWVVVSLNREIDFLSSQLRTLSVCDVWNVDLEDLVSSAIFQLNSRERPIVIDHLLNLYSPDLQQDDTLCEYLTLAIQLVYDRLSPIIPGNMDVQEYSFVGEDIMIGGKLF